MPNIFDGFNKAQDKDIINQIVLLKTITFSNLLKVEGRKTLKSTTSAINFITGIFTNKLKIEEPIPKTIEDIMREETIKIQDFSRDKLNLILKRELQEKVKNKIELQRELGLNQDPKAMMIGIVSRLTDQKGFDLIAYVMDELCQDNIQLVVLGTGEEQYENMFRHFAWKYQGKVSANIFYDNAMSHKIYASCDAFLMPSLFEPCGLSQLMSLRYGTIPIVRETGGLKDTVDPYNEYESTGTGFSFTNYNAHEMLATVRYAEAVYYDRKREWNKLIDRAMAKDFSWGNSAKQYEEMYNWLIG